MNGEVLILGSGTSTGTPIPGCPCSVCHSLDKRDNRLRSSIFLRTQNGNKILVDTSPDLRTQLLTNQITNIDGVLITHEHADHLHGIDDLRPMCFRSHKKRLPIWTHEKCAQSMVERFPYIFHPDQVILGGGIPTLDLHVPHVSDQALVTLNILEEEFLVFLLPHGKKLSMGFIHRGFCYVPDCHTIPDWTIQELKSRQLKLLIIPCVQKGAHATHLNLAKSLDYISQIAPQNAGLIHMNHDLGHQELTDLLTQYHLPINIFPLYDGQLLQY